MPRWVEPLLFLMAAIAIGRAMVQQNVLDFHDYAYGQEHMPFAARYLMQPALRWADHNPVWLRFAASMRNSSTGPIPLFVQLTNGISLLLTGLVAERIRKLVLPGAVLPWLTRWLLLWIVTVTYVVRYEQRYAQAYDLPSVLIWSLGILFTLRSWNVPFLLLMLVGTYNRETTLLLIPVWLTYTLPRAHTSRVRVLSLSVALIAGVEWLLVRRQILHWVGKASSGWGFALGMNVRQMLLPHHLPQVLSVGGFLAIPLWLHRRAIRDAALRHLWWGTIPFLLAALLFGWLNETRIFGELSVLFAVTAATVFEAGAFHRGADLRQATL